MTMNLVTLAKDYCRSFIQSFETRWYTDNMWPPSSHEAARTTKHRKCNQERAEQGQDEDKGSEREQAAQKKEEAGEPSKSEQKQEEAEQEQEEQEDIKQEEEDHEDEQGIPKVDGRSHEGDPHKINDRDGGAEEDGHQHSSPLPTSALTLSATGRPTSLLDLPEELWLEIGKMVINDLPITIIQAIADVSTEYSERCGHIHYQNIDTLSPRPLPPAILQTSSALRRELRPVYFSEKIVIEISIRSAAPRLLLLDQYMGLVGRSACQKIKGVVRWGHLTKATHTPDPCYRGMWERNFRVVYGEAVRTEGEESDGLFWNVTFA